MTRSKKDLISLIVPCYNEEETVELFVKEIDSLKEKMNYVDFEIIFVDDGSKDRTLEKIKTMSINKKYIKYISFARNFGKEYAMLAGFDACHGDYATAIDVDLQHPPKLLIKMYDIIKKENYDCIAAKSTKRQKYSILRKLLTNIYYKLINSITEVEMVRNATDYRLMNRKMINAMKEIREHNRYLKGIFEIIGFKTKWIEYEDNERVAGKTKWSLHKLFKYAVTGIVSFSQFPLMLIIYLGILFSLVTVVLLILLLVFLCAHMDVNFTFWGLLAIIFLLSSITLCSNGILGLYIAQIQTESKNRPLYLIKDKNIE